MNNFNQANVVVRQGFDGRGFTDQNTLSKAILNKPDSLSPVLTHLMGKESKKFPMTFLTEGMGNIKFKNIKELNDVEFTWPVVGRLKKADSVASSQYTVADTNIGILGAPVYITMKSNWFKKSRNIVHKSGAMLRVSAQGVPVGNGWTKYRCTNLRPSTPISYLALAVNAKWAMEGAAHVSESNSMGTESNVVTPGKIKSQMSILRKSYRIAGNISNKYVEFQFKAGDKSTNLWMDFERWQHMMAWQEEVEETLWYDEYNRNSQGEITTIDEDSNEPIPYMGGVFYQVPNEDTYSFLTTKRIKRTVSDALSGATDTGNTEITLFCGEGFADDFDVAMKDEASGFTQVMGEKSVTGSGRNLTLGGYFTSYEHIDGHVIRLAKLPLLDYGSRAEIADKHPITGKPITSHEGHFIDTSTYDGEKNIQMVAQKGRSLITGVLKGMAPTPWDFAGNSSGNESLATEQDQSSFHMLKTTGIAIKRNTHCFSLRCDIS
jgi:hypothetical protein